MKVIYWSKHSTDADVQKATLNKQAEFYRIGLDKVMSAAADSIVQSDLPRGKFIISSSNKMIDDAAVLSLEQKYKAKENFAKPEPLRFALNGCWSHRINQQHRLIYRINDGMLQIVSCRFHYN